MKNTPKYFIVEAEALPEVFLKVAEAKRLIATGQASTVNEATKMTGISRSAMVIHNYLQFHNLMLILHYLH